MIRKKCDEKATLTTRQRLRQTLTATKLQQFFETNPFIIKKNAVKCAKTDFSALLFVNSNGLCIFAANHSSFFYSSFIYVPFRFNPA